MEGTDRQAVRRKKAQLDEATRHLAEALMDASLHEAMQDKHVSKFLPQD
jgi:hypothetical protein